MSVASPAAVVLLACLLSGCGADAGEGEGPEGEDAASGAPAPAADGVPDSDATAADALGDHEAYLRSIGYAGFADSPVAEGPDGVVLRDPERSQPGYDLYSVVPMGLSVLLDPEGREVNRWQVEGAVWAMRCELLPDGDVVVVGTEGDPRDADSHLVRMSWDGDEVWRRGELVHHDVELTPAGELLTIASDLRALPELDDTRLVDDNLLLWVSTTGERLRSVSLHDLLAAAPGFELVEPPHQGLTGRWYDHLHANSVAAIPPALVAADDPLYGPDNVLVSLRHQDSVVIVDTARGELVWAWGRGELVMQHEASWLPDGNVLLFDNGNEDRPWSRLVEVDPRSDTITWQWTAPNPRDVYTAGRGTVQRLPGGNLLVAHSNKGEAFELTRDGELVWRFLSPHRDKRGRRGAIRTTRYPVEYVEAILERRGAR